MQLESIVHMQQGGATKRAMEHEQESSNENSTSDISVQVDIHYAAWF